MSPQKPITTYSAVEELKSRSSSPRTSSTDVDNRIVGYSRNVNVHEWMPEFSRGCVHKRSTRRQRASRIARECPRENRESEREREGRGGAEGVRKPLFSRTPFAIPRFAVYGKLSYTSRVATYVNDMDASGYPVDVVGRIIRLCHISERQHQEHAVSSGAVYRRHFIQSNELIFLYES